MRLKLFKSIKVSDDGEVLDNIRRIELYFDGDTIVLSRDALSGRLIIRSDVGLLKIYPGSANAIEIDSTER